MASFISNEEWHVKSFKIYRHEVNEPTPAGRNNIFVNLVQIRMLPRALGHPGGIDRSQAKAFILWYLMPKNKTLVK